MSFHSRSDRRLLGPGHTEATFSNPETTSPSKRQAKEAEDGVTAHGDSGVKLTVAFQAQDVRGSTSPAKGDKLEFSVRGQQRSGQQTATCVQLVGGNSKAQRLLHCCVAALKDKFGFTETASHEREIFLRCREFPGDVDSLDLGDVVQYSLSEGNTVSAGNVSKTPSVIDIPEEAHPTLVTSLTPGEC